MDKIKILYMMNSLNCGGEENFVMNVYRSINRELVDIIFCVPDIDGSEQYFEGEILSNRGTVVKIPSKSQHPIEFYFKVKKLIKDKGIQCVHYHSDNSMLVLGLIAARRGGAKLLISHSHNSNISGMVYNIAHRVFRPLLNYVSDVRYACSDKAGKWMYGNKSFEIVNNGIDLSQYAYSEKVRVKIRSDLGLNEGFVIGHVGRFEEVKNHTFIVDLAYEYKKKYGTNFTVLFLGEGSLLASIQEKVKDLGLKNNVLFLGNRRNVNEYLQAMDCFVFPSLYEGLPLSLVEAQASGLPCLVSDNVSRQAKVLNRVSFIPISLGPEPWIKAMEDTRLKHFSRNINIDEGIAMQKYDINVISNTLTEVYRNV